MQLPGCAPADPTRTLLDLICILLNSSCGIECFLSITMDYVTFKFGVNSSRRCAGCFFPKSIYIYPILSSMLLWFTFLAPGPNPVSPSFRQKAVPVGLAKPQNRCRRSTAGVSQHFATCGRARFPFRRSSSSPYYAGPIGLERVSNYHQTRNPPVHEKYVSIPHLYTHCQHRLYISMHHRRLFPDLNNICNMLISDRI